MNTLQHEIDARTAAGARCVSMRQLAREFAALGYRFDRSCDCRSTARYMTGARQGETYPALSLYPVQISDGLSAWNVNARRDDNFARLQALRSEVFAVSRGHIAEI